jgi:hypothetical protein
MNRKKCTSSRVMKIRKAITVTKTILSKFRYNKLTMKWEITHRELLKSQRLNRGKTNLTIKFRL